MNHIRTINPDWPWLKTMPLGMGVVGTGSMVFLTGQTAIDADGRVVGENDLRAQTRQCFENIGELLRLAGAGFSDIARLTTYFTVDITDAAVRQAYWEVRAEFLGAHKPASTGIRVAALAHPALLLEIDVIAVLPRS